MASPITTPGGTDDSKERNPSKGSSLQRIASQYLTKASYCSTPFISTFLLIHLSAPVFANLGGSSLSSQVMILGREYYQTPFIEKYLLFAPLAIHSLSGLTKRLLSSRTRPPRSLVSKLSITGYTMLSIFLPIHVLTHRFLPTDPAPPIYAVGPSELDYEFVKVGLATWPWRSWALYAGLIGLVALHASEGISIIWHRWLSNNVEWAGIKNKGRQSTRRIINIALGALVVPVLSGLYIVSREPLMTLSSLAVRFQAVFTQSFVYRI